jgi:pyruvate,water dikinase
MNILKTKEKLMPDHINSNRYIAWYQDLGIKDLALVGGKNASLGEMVSSLKGEEIKVPDGFATTSDAYWEFVEFNKLKAPIQQNITKYHNTSQDLQETGKSIRQLFYESEFPPEMKAAILKAYKDLSQKNDATEIRSVAVRSSATAEDLPDASFAGQLETFLNINGEQDLLDSCKKCFASLFTDRAISYREAKGFDDEKIALSVGIQEMIRSDLSGSGVMFTIDTETGFKDSIVINASWGLGENVVQGAVNPDEYMVFKPVLTEHKLKPILSKKLGSKEIKMIYASGTSKSTLNIATTKDEQEAFVLNDTEIIKLANWGHIIEKHYNKAMDIEWAKDGINGELYMVQARPETVQSRKDSGKLYQYKLTENIDPILEGLAIGGSIVTGKVQILQTTKDIRHFEEGSILVTERTDPDWVPIMKKASGIITNSGGRTSHAAIVSRELSLPVIVGAENATSILEEHQKITLSCAEGERGKVYDGYLQYTIEEIDLNSVLKINTEIMLNLADPDASMRWWQLPCKGIGLARIEFIISNIIKVHPMALLEFNKVKDKHERKAILDLTRNHSSKKEYFVTELARAIAKIAASQYPQPAIVRMSDFKSNEYAGLIGGTFFEKEESNPMLGFRGAARYYSDSYKDAFALECQAIKKAREEIGLDNIIVMIPFCRTLEEADKVLRIMGENGLTRGEKKLEIYVMAEIPSNIILAEEFATRFDGFSIGSNDLTQLVLGISRDSEELSEIFDENNEAVKQMIRELIAKAHKAGAKVGFCGQAPSDKEGYAEFLVSEGIDSISLNPDSVISVMKSIADM